MVESLRKELRELGELEKHPAFLLLIKQLQAEIDELQYALVMKPIQTLDESLAQEYKKGCIAGRFALQSYVAQRKEELEYEINQLKEQKDETQ